jgi:16S rRNA (guanine527-N7)-methyltransferase
MNQALNGTLLEIAGAFADAGITGLPPEALDRFLAYLQVLLRWNARLNLTAIREPEQIVRRHFVECAFAAGLLPNDAESLLDYGSGAGFPGIPVAICRPEIHVVLAESQGKKAAFLREALRAIGTTSEVFHGRVDGLPKGQLFDAVTLRAVEKMEAAIPVAVERTRKYLLLFSTQTSMAAHLRVAKHLEWLEPVLLPGSTQMALLLGRVNQDVSA